MKVLMPPQSGSLGNQTASRNRSGQYLRQRSLPVQPRTAAQVGARMHLTTQSAAWRGITEVQRNSWKAFSQSFTVVNSLGQTINLTGHQCFVKVNATLLTMGLTVVLVPPSLPSFAACTATAVTSAAGTPAMAIAATAPVAGTKYMLYASGQLSAGVSYNNSWKYIDHRETFATGTEDILASYTAKQGTLVAGKKIFLKIVQAIGGMQDNGTVLTCIVAA